MNIIIDYGLGNIHSILRTFERLGMEAVISHRPDELKEADSLILPGVGAFGDAMDALKERNLVPLIREHTEKGGLLLGICLGMQLLYEKSSENGEHEGLGLLQGRVDRLEGPLKVPHMGWNRLKCHREDPLLKYISEGDYVYFVHSYYVNAPLDHLIAYAEYGRVIPGIVRKNNIIGMQFHPEKSGEVGFRLLKAYGEMIR